MEKLSLLKKIAKFQYYCMMIIHNFYYYKTLCIIYSQSHIIQSNTTLRSSISFVNLKNLCIACYTVRSY